MSSATRDDRTVEWILRVGVAACFIGHGAFGLLRKPAWLEYFAALGIGPETGAALMPLVGALDITVGVAALVRPVPAVLAWAMVWGFTTALLRPLAGEPIWEVLERAGNFGVPLALLLLLAARGGYGRDVVGRTVKRIVGPMVGWSAGPDGGPRHQAATRGGLAPAASVLHWSTVALLLGHGALAAGGKAQLAAHFAAVGLPEGWIVPFGVFEIGAALLLALAPVPGLLFGVVALKLATEVLYPLSGAPLWEFVERGGSYAAPLALGVMAARSLVAPPTRWRSLGPRLIAPGLVLLASLAGASGVQAQGREARSSTWEAVVRDVPSADRLQAVVDRLREGGSVLFCRHAITERASDRGPTREQQRNLDERGRQQARAMGAALSRLGVPFGDVLSSPMFRTMDSAELAFGRVEAEPVLRDPRAGRPLRDLLSMPPRGGNRVLMSHQGVIRRHVSIGDAPLAEGDCLVIDPEGPDGGYAVLARIGAGDWGRAAGAQ